MKKIFIAFSLLLVVLLMPIAASAQRAKPDAASRKWGAFWRQFSVAVNKKNLGTVRRLMSSEADFFNGEGGGRRDGWLKDVARERWSVITESVASGTVPWEGRKDLRVTRDNVLAFRFIAGRWRFTGAVGD